MSEIPESVLCLSEADYLANWLDLDGVAVPATTRAWLHDFIADPEMRGDALAEMSSCLLKISKIMEKRGLFLKQHAFYAIGHHIWTVAQRRTN